MFWQEGAPHENSERKADKQQDCKEHDMIREMSLRNALLQRSDNDWLDGLLAEKPEYEGSLRMVVGMSAWMYDIANSPFAMRTLAASEAGSREVSASATAMREVSASENAVAVILGTDQALATVVASAVAMSAISASAVARDAIKNNPTAYASVLGNHMAVGKFAVGAAGLDPAPFADIEAVAASSTAMQAVAASTAARTVLWQSDAFLACLQANNASIQAIISANLATTKNTAASAFQFEAQGTKLILLRRYYDGASESDYLQWDRNASNLPGYGQPNTYDATYARSGSAPTANNATANCVRACSGLNRASWAVGNTLTVIYLKV